MAEFVVQAPDTRSLEDVLRPADGKGRNRQARRQGFQMAEVAVPRMLFTEILRLIAELRPPPDPAPA